MPDMNENAETQQEYLGRCHDCTAPQTEVNMLSRHILELQADKGRLTDELTKKDKQIKELQEELEELKKNNNILFNATEKVGNKNNELKKQIEKMKCCQNCKHHYFMGNDLECKLIDCDNNESWELAK